MRFLLVPAVALAILSASARAETPGPSGGEPTTPASAEARSAGVPTRTLSVNVPGLLFGFYGIEFQLKRTDTTTWFIEPSVLVIRPGLFSTGVIGPSLKGGLRHFFAGHAPQGAFVAGEAILNLLTANSYLTTFGYGVGGEVGYSTLWFDRIEASVGIGAIVSHGYTYQGFNQGFNALPIVRLDLGYAF